MIINVFVKILLRNNSSTSIIFLLLDLIDSYTYFEYFILIEFKSGQKNRKYKQPNIM